MFDDQYWRVPPARAGAPLTGPSRWAVRRHARRHGQPTVGDLVAYWRAQRLGRRVLRGQAARPPRRVRVSLVLALLAAALVVTALYR